MVPRVGQRVGPYEILGRLGSGGMGLVFSAWDARLQRDVAIKLLRDEFSSPDMRQRFLQEARAASGLNHPNICTIFDIGEQSGDPYLVMELLKGETLRARIASGNVSPDDITRVATEVADALIVAHTRGIIHRDIKPANIMLVDKPGGRFGTKVLDFGLAKVDMGEGQDNRFDLTSVGSTVGTVSYMSPEQARGEILDPRSDLFSLGVVLYEMATGQLPFRGATSALVFVQLLSQPPDPPREINAAIPKDLERVILKLLEKDRNGRFQNAAELVETLHKIPIRGGSAGKSIWGAIPSLVRSRSDISVARAPIADQTTPSASRPAQPPSERPKTPMPPAVPQAAQPPAPPAAPKPMGESILRPVKRIVERDEPLPVRPPSDPPTPVAQMAAAAEDLAPSSHASESVISPSGSSVSEAKPPSSSSGSAAPKPRSSSALPQLGSARTHASRATTQRMPPNRFKQDLGEETPERPSRARSSNMAMPRYLIIGLVVAVAAVATWLFWPKHAAPVASPSPTVVLAAMDNRTGDGSLPGAVVGGLSIDIRQSSRLNLKPHAALIAGLHTLGIADSGSISLDDARKGAAAIGATHVLFGEIHNAAASSYTITVRVYDVTTAAKIAENAETAATREQLSSAIDSLAADIRSGLGESGDTLTKALPLSKLGSVNADALSDYAAGQDLMDQGQLGSALGKFDDATHVDQNFAPAWLRLADIYRRENAAVAAEQAATKARDASAAGDKRLQFLGQASYELNTTGNYPQAASLLQQSLAAYPNDPEASYQLATALRLQGMFPESLDAAQKVLQVDPYDLEATGVAEADLLALKDSPAAASQMEQQLQKSGRRHPGLKILMDYLGNRDVAVPSDLNSDSDRIVALQYSAEISDARGQLAAGLLQWRSLVSMLAKNAALTSAAGEELANAAMNRAMLGDCTTATSLVRDAATYPEGLLALFHSGMASALCGQVDAANARLNDIRTKYPESYAAKGFLSPDLHAAIQWKQNDAAGAIATLEAADHYDTISVTRYLRGMIELKTNPIAANGDFQFMLDHRGAMVLVNPTLRPLSYIGHARAYLASNDKGGHSAAEYAEFLKLWSGADRQLELLHEAQQNSH